MAYDIISQASELSALPLSAKSIAAVDSIDAQGQKFSSLNMENKELLLDLQNTAAALLTERLLTTFDALDPKQKEKFLDMVANQTGEIINLEDLRRLSPYNSIANALDGLNLCMEHLESETQLYARLRLTIEGLYTSATSVNTVSKIKDTEPLTYEEAFARLSAQAARTPHSRGKNRLEGFWR